MHDADSIVVERQDFAGLFEILRSLGYAVVGPTVKDQAIVYDQLSQVDDLPIGWTDEQEAGHYRLRRRNDAALFGYAVGPHSWKKFLHPPRLRLFQAERSEDGAMVFKQEPVEAPKYAFLGVRSCEAHAIAIQDRVFLEGAVADPTYRERRIGALLIAVNCGFPSSTCFCHSMKTGPGISQNTKVDIELTELLDDEGHRFVFQARSQKGQTIVDRLPARRTTRGDLDAAEALVAEATETMTRELNAEGVRDLLYANLEHPRWDEVADRCLTCANCTMVCPTCFCTTVEDVTDITGDHAERWRRWDSCFTLDFSHMPGGSSRQTSKSRYRQWLTHKLATWHDQFGTSGCVGCGRCISWCPVGIDLTEEIQVMGQSTQGVPSS